MILALIVSVLLSALAPNGRGPDYGCTYLAARNVLAGQSPYAVSCYLSPLWIVIADLPLALLTPTASYHIYLVISLACTLVALMSFRRWKVALLLGVPLIVMTYVWGNIEWVVLVGYVLPFPFALPFLLSKPQIGFVLVALLTCQAWRAGQRRSVIVSCAVMLVLFGASFAAGMTWGGVVSHAEYLSANIADLFWPWGIPLGAWLAFVAFRRRSSLLAIIAAVFISPYTGSTAVELWSPLFADVDLRLEP